MPEAEVQNTDGAADWDHVVLNPAGVIIRRPFLPNVIWIEPTQLTCWFAPSIVIRDSFLPDLFLEEMTEAVG